MSAGDARYWIETLGCPKNEVDSDRLAGRLASQGYAPADSASDADLVVVNTCAFIEDARQESIDTILALSDNRAPGAEIVVTGCLAERYGDQVADAIPEADAVVGFGVPVTLGPTKGRALLAGRDDVPSFDLLNLPRPPATRPWAYVKVAEGCDRACGFCAIPQFRGPQRSRAVADVLAEIEALEAAEVVLVAQDLASYGRDQGQGQRSLVEVVRAATKLVDRVRLLYLYPSELSDELVGAVLDTGVPYFDLSLQHVSAPLLRAMRRWGNAEKFLDRIAAIRRAEPQAVFRSNVIIGYPGETEADQDALLAFLEAAQLDWCGVFTYSEEEGTHAAGLGDKVAAELVAERRAEVAEVVDRITAQRRDELIGSRVGVLVDAPGVARSFREAPEIDGIITVPADLPTGTFHDVLITAAAGPDLAAAPEGLRLVQGLA